MAFAPPSARDAVALVRRVLLALLLANLAVVGVKAVIAVRANSLAILGAALDSAVDALNNGLAMLLVQVAAKEPDEEHPYGHGKFETLGTLAIVGFLSVSCFELVRGAVNHLASGGHPVIVTDFQLAVLVLTVGVNVLVAWYEQRRGGELGSQLLIADASHTRADVFVTVGVLVGVLLARQGWWWADPVVAIGVAGVILRVAYGIVSRAVPVLVDQRALPPSEIQGTAEAVRGVKSAYRIRSRGAPPLRYAEVTISVDRGANVADAHAIADEVEERLKRNLQLHEVIVHVEPC
jgi:cation diffusion facilitator family transporter